MKLYEVSGFVAVVIPFFSEKYLPEENDLATEVTDFRDYYVNTTNGRIPKYYCVRLSPNGKDVRQLCEDPNAKDPAERGKVRAATEEMWNDLKRGCLLYTSPSPRDRQKSRMPSSA